MFIVYNPNIPNRLKYVFKFVFNELLLADVSFTKDKEEFSNSEKYKINYSNVEFEGVLHFRPYGLLNKKGIEEVSISVAEWKGVKTFFKVKSEKFPFDPFSAIFYLISRYEEYLPHKRDHYNRFIPENSIAFNNDFLQIPLVDHWGELLKERIKEYYPQIKIKRRTYTFLSTIDVDNAYAYKEKGFVRTLGALAHSFVTGRTKDLAVRVNTLLGKQKDPFDRFEEMHQVHQKYQVDSLYFFLLADYGLNDKNVPHTSKKFQTLIKEVADYYNIGIHPSFGSNSNKQALKNEIERLFNITHIDVRASRQHFLKLQFPSTYRNLIEHEITDDYTMGYAAETGFRASTCSSFYFYDLDREQETKLKVHPFCVMDASLRHYLNVDVNEVVEKVNVLVNEVKKVNGAFTMLWHNESLSEIYPWKGWGNIYEEVVKIAHK